MQPKLVELGVMLNHQLPILVSFVFLRLAGVFTVSTLFRKAVPSRFIPLLDKAAMHMGRARRLVMLAGISSMMVQMFFDLPSGPCKAYESVRTQGISALISLAVLMTTNNALASAIAIASLRAVATTSPSSMWLSSSAAFMASSGLETGLFTYGLFWVALVHAGFCHDDKTPGLTHGSIITVLAIIFNVILYIVHFFYLRMYNITSKMLSTTKRLARAFKPHRQ